MKYYVQISKGFNPSGDKYQILDELQIGDYVELKDSLLTVVESRHYCVKNNHMIFLVKNIGELELPPLIEDFDHLNQIKRYRINYRGWTTSYRNDLFVEFFNRNIGRKVEIGVVGDTDKFIYKVIFVIDDNISGKYIRPNDILDNPFSNEIFQYESIYSAKIINF